MNAQQKYYHKNKSDPYFKLCHAISLAKYRDTHREEYNKYMREYRRNKKAKLLTNKQTTVIL